MVVNSAYRTESYNAKVNGASRSKHLYGMAADIRIDYAARYPIVTGPAMPSSLIPADRWKYLTVFCMWIRGRKDISG